MWSKIFGSGTDRERRQDLLLLGATLALVTIGTIMIYSSSSFLALERYNDGKYFVKKQLFFVVFGIVLMNLISRIDYTILRKLAYPGLVAAIALLVLVLVPGFGIKAGGATRWLRLGVVGVQVSEFVKLGLVIFLAHYLARQANREQGLVRNFFYPLLVSAVCAGLIYRQPDFGTAIMLMVITLSIMFLSGTKIRYIAALGVLLVPLALYLIYQKSYRWERLTSFLNPWGDPLNSGFQIIQSLISFGSGGAFGVGLGDGMQKLFYLPEPHTDFILSIIAEESGLVGVAVVISLFALLIFRGFVIAWRARDFFGNLLAAGLTMIIAFGAAINVLGVMGLIPLKGLALPFISYGGSSLVMSMSAVGILLSISSRCRD